jgi:hypothetical protein
MTPPRLSFNPALTIILPFLTIDVPDHTNLVETPPQETHCNSRVKLLFWGGSIPISLVSRRESRAVAKPALLWESNIRMAAFRVGDQGGASARWRWEYMKSVLWTLCGLLVAAPFGIAQERPVMIRAGTVLDGRGGTKSNLAVQIVGEASGPEF